MVRNKKKVNDKTVEHLPEGQILSDASNVNWRLSNCIGQGGFGLIYAAYMCDNVKNSSPNYVIKMEASESGPLFCEKQVYIRALNEKNLNQWCTDHNLLFIGLPRYVGFGSHDFGGKKYRFLVMDRFGKDLQTKIELCKNYKLNVNEAYQISIDIINALEYLHEHEYVHADIKASNLLLSLNTDTKYVLADFGLSFRYVANGVHKKYTPRPKKSHNGTIEFTSRDAHVGTDPSRRGDLEILGFCLVRWICGFLPWDNDLKVPNNVAKLKNENIENLGKFMETCFPSSEPPKGLVGFFELINNLEYTEQPNYEAMRQVLSCGIKGGKKAPSKGVEPLHSSKRTCVDSFVESDRPGSQSMTTLEYFDLHPSADTKRGTKICRVPAKRTDSSCQTNMDLIN